MQEVLRKRSPRAPSLALEEAIERVMRVYEQERLHAAPADAVAKALGFANANSGSAATSIASLRYFGLLERPKEGFLAVSKAIETYKYAPDTNLKRKILFEFLVTPPLYRELLEKYSNSLPSSATLKYELIQKGFLPQAVDSVLSAFLQSVSFAEYFKVDPENITRDQLSKSIDIEDDIQLEEPKEQSLERMSSTRPQLLANHSMEMDQIPIRLSGGRKAWLNIPTPFYESDKLRIKAYVDVLFADEEAK
jgi:hypothetical protein